MDVGDLVHKALNATKNIRHNLFPEASDEQAATMYQIIADEFMKPEQLDEAKRVGIQKVVLAVRSHWPKLALLLVVSLAFLVGFYLGRPKSEVGRFMLFKDPTLGFDTKTGQLCFPGYARKDLMGDKERLYCSELAKH